VIVRNARRLATAALVGAALSFSSPCEAQLKLRVADALPVGHYISEYATKFWMAESTRLSGGAVDFEYYPGEQLGKAKDILSLTQTGVIDVGYVATSYISEKLPLSSVAELPGSFKTACEGTRAYWALATGNGILAKQEFEANGVRVLFALALPPYQLLTAKRRVEDLQSAAGLKVRIPGGGALDAMVRGMNAVPVRISSPELHEALARGTIDGLLFPFGSIFTYDLAPLLKYATIGENFGTAVIAYVISNAKWKTLAPNEQDALAKAGLAATERACAMVDGDAEKEGAKLSASRVELVTISNEKGAQFRTLNETVAREWAEQLDKRGKPGNQVLQAFREALSR
jgi:TRAP-type C4-dicarboxylate transport system substrate-binding protein